MTRDARLYFLKYKDWKPLAEIIETHKNYNLKHFVTIFQLMTHSSENHHYAILSLIDDVDKIIEEYGAEEAGEKDLVRNTLHDYYGEPLYGSKSNVTFLNKIT